VLQRTFREFVELARLGITLDLSIPHVGRVFFEPLAEFGEFFLRQFGYLRL
jgi:hypothetical protein